MEAQAASMAALDSPPEPRPTRFFLSPNRRLAVSAALILLYFVTGKLGLRLALIHPSATAVWAPAGISLAACLIFGSWVAPAVFIGAFLVNATTAGSIPTSLAIAAGNTLEAVAGAYLVERFAGGPNAFDKTADALKFFFFAAICSTLIAPTIGVISLCLGGYAQWPAFDRIWLTWWLGDAAGDLIAAPVLILWSLNPRIEWSFEQKIEAMSLLFVLCLTAGIMFGGWLPASMQSLPLDFLGLPVLLWAAFRFGPREAATALFILLTVAIVGTLHGHGPYSLGDKNEGLMLLQTFAGLTALMVIVVATEVAQRRNIDEERAGLAAIVDASSDSIVGETLDGRISSWNSGATASYGYSPSEALGRPVTLVVPQDRVVEEQQILERVLHGEVVNSFETVRRRKDGTLFDVSLTVSPVRNRQGRIIGASRIARDISDQKRAARGREELLRSEHAARESAEAAAKAKDDFLAMLAHELRNPLQAISLALRLPAADGSAHAIIARQTEHVSRMVDGLLDVARVTTGRIALMRRPINLADVIGESIGALRGTGQLDRHQIHSGLEAVWVNGDADRIAQMVTNLLNNATTYTPAGGQINVSVRSEDANAVIRVEDNGVGIAADVLPYIFDLFARGDLGLRRAPSGLGLGLTLVKRLAELHDGDVEAHSGGPGLGSTFIVRLPRIAPPALQKVDPIVLSDSSASSRRILIVEDNADARDVLRDFLEMSGHDIYEAEDGPGGVKLALSILPDVALIDIGLPGFDGYEVASRIRSSAAASSTSLIAVSGYGQNEYRTRAMEAGFDRYLVKPVDPGELVELISTLPGSDQRKYS